MNSIAVTTPATTTVGPAVLPVVGFVVKKILATPPKEKDEEDMGKIQIVLECQSQDIRATGKDLVDILGALNLHRMTRESVAVQLRF